MHLTTARALQYFLILLVIGGITGGYFYFRSKAAQTVTDNRPSFEAPLTHTLDLAAGVGSPTFSRADGADRRATVTDFENRIIPVKQNEARFEGARRVENLLSKSEAFDNASWTKTSVTVSADSLTDAKNLGTTADTLTASGANGTALQAVTASTATYVYSIYLERKTGSGNIQLSVDGTTFTTVTLTTAWQRFSVTASVSAGTINPGIRIVTSGDAVYAWGAQLELISGQANQNPGEYVSCGVKTASPYHGAGIDCVKYSNVQNGNTVASNVVTEATGAAISDSTLKGYLAEGSRTNLILRSEEFDNASWTKSNATVTVNATTAPSGQLVSEKLIENSGTGNKEAHQTYASFSSGVAYTATVYAKAAERGRIRFNYTGGGIFGSFTSPIFDISNGTILAGVGGGLNPTIQSAGNGWYRLSITGTTTSAGSSIAYISLIDDSNQSNYTGDGTSGLYLWGAQLEQASFASSYILTTSASVTRAMDTLKYTDASNWSDTVGTVTMEVTPRWSTGSGWSAYFMDDTSVVNRRSIWHWSGTANVLTADRKAGDGTRNYIDYSGLSISEGSLMRLGARWTSAAVSIFRDGALRGSNTTLTLPYAAVSGIVIGHRADLASGQEACATIKNVRSWKKALSDTELQNLTSLTTAVSTSAIKKEAVKVPNNTGLVGYWSFEDGSGTKATDFAGNNNTGTLTNGPTWTDGRVGKALSFDGVDDYVTAGDIDALDLAPKMTVSVWVKQSSLVEDSIAVGKYDSGGGHFDLRVGQSGAGGSDDIRFRFDFSNYAFTDSNVHKANEWEHWVAVFDGTQIGNSNRLKLYLNGISQSLSFVGSVPTTLGNNAYPLVIGNRGDLAGPSWNGQIDDVRIYDTALTQAQVTELYQFSSIAKINVSQNDKLTNGLVGLWSFNGPDLSSTTAYDRSGQGNNGTLTNGPTVTEGKIGQALSFDGTDDYVSAGDIGALDLASQMTVSLWVNQSSLVDSALSIGKYDSVGGGHFDFKTGETGNEGSDDIVFRFSFSNYGYTTENVHQANRWEHWVAVFDGTQTGNSNRLKMYVNGTAQTLSFAGTVPSTLGDNAYPLVIGNRGDLAGPAWNGRLDEVRVYNRALSASEATTLYNMGR